MGLEAAKAMFLLRAGDYGSHRAALLKALTETDGSVLELGMGYESTPFLHAYCAEAERRLVSIESNHSWLKRFLPLKASWHELIHVADWSYPLIDEVQWGLALVDHSPAERRTVELKRLKGHCQVAVVHDLGSCAPPFGMLREMFTYACLDETSPPTGIVSDTVDVSGWF